MRSSRAIALSCGLVDATVVILAALAAPAVLGADVGWILLHNAPVFAFLIPLGALVFWRGASDGRRWLEGRPSPVRLAVEGFIIGFAMVFVANGLVIASVAFAAGPLFPDLEAPASEWLVYGQSLIPWALGAGGLGAAIGGGFSLLNGLITQALHSEQAPEPDAPETGAQ